MKIPKINQFCRVLYDGRICAAEVVGVNQENKTFDVKTSFGASMLNIPFDRFDEAQKIQTAIANRINSELNLSLLTVDVFAMEEIIYSVLKEYGRL